MNNHPMTEEEIERGKRTLATIHGEISDARIYDLEEKLLRMTADRDGWRKNAESMGADRDKWRKLRLEALDLIKELEKPPRAEEMSRTILGRG